MEKAKQIQQIRDLLKDLTNESKSAKTSLADCEKASQDILHQVELGSYAEGRKYYSKLRQVRKQRRVHKDTIELLTPLMNLLETKEGVYFLKQLDEVLGATRILEHKLEDRQYVAKYYTDLPVSK